VALAQEGMKTVLVARSAEALGGVASVLPCPGLVFAGDLRHRETAGRAVEAAVARFGRLDLLVNNAGATRRADFLELTDEDWQDGFALKFFGAARLCREAWPHLRKAQGSIINIAGVGGRAGAPEAGIVGSVNAAVMHLTKTLAARGIADGIRVNAVNPGSIVTDRLAARIEVLATEAGVPAAEAAVRQAAKLGVARFGEPAEIARVVAFVASPLNGYLQGAILDVDGGQNRAV
jgi:3-oxoacyl-[acyl-carrier protein] reductase